MLSIATMFSRRGVRNHLWWWWGWPLATGVGDDEDGRVVAERAAAEGGVEGAVISTTSVLPKEDSDWANPQASASASATGRIA